MSPSAPKHGTKHIHRCVGERSLALPRTQMSLFQCARKGRREGDPSHGPLRFVTSYLRSGARLFHAKKRLRRRLYVAWPVPGSQSVRTS